MFRCRDRADIHSVAVWKKEWKNKNLSVIDMQLKSDSDVNVKFKY